MTAGLVIKEGPRTRGIRSTPTVDLYPICRCRAGRVDYDGCIERIGRNAASALSFPKRSLRTGSG